MTYAQWYRDFGDRHRAIVATLGHLSDEEVIAYFDYDNLRLRHPDFCPLYATGEKCHDTDDLNCYLCGCPHFRYCDTGWGEESAGTRYSRCAITARFEQTFTHEGSIHTDCSACPLPHTTGFIREHFDRDWGKIMEECEGCVPHT
jgi:hypothetical protein